MRQLLSPPELAHVQTAVYDYVTEVIQAQALPSLSHNPRALCDSLVNLVQHRQGGAQMTVTPARKVIPAKTDRASVFTPVPGDLSTLQYFANPEADEDAYRPHRLYGGGIAALAFPTVIRFCTESFSARAAGYMPAFLTVLGAGSTRLWQSPALAPCRSGLPRVRSLALSFQK